MYIECERERDAHPQNKHSNKANQSNQTPTGKIRLLQSAARYYGSLPEFFLPPGEATPPFVYAVGKGEAPVLEARRGV